MKDEIKDDEVYFIGNQEKRKFYRRKAFYIVIIAVVIVAVIGAIALHFKGGSNNNNELVMNGNKMEVVEILPKGSQPPSFEGEYESFVGKHGMSKFDIWVCKNLKYPKGYETVNDKVVVSFVIQGDGTLGQFKVVTPPKNKVFTESVLSMLRRCPKWKPARLANGKVVGVRYEIPVLFRMY